MLRKVIMSTAAIGALAIASPAFAHWGGSSGGCSHCGGSTSGGWTPTPPPSTTSGGSSTSGGTQVPEPGMLGLAGAGLIGLGFVRSNRRKQAKK